MAHKLLRIEEKLCNVPHLVHPAAFEKILKYMDSRAASDFQTAPKAEIDNDEYGRYAYNSDVGVAVMNIEGPLTYKPITMFGMDCGGASYETLKSDFSYLVDQGAKTIALNFDSPGGEAYQCFATGRFLRNLADENGVKIISFVDGLAASAAYGLASIADEIIVAEGSEVGSIGVLVRLMNDSKFLEQKGLERTFVTAGKEKIPYAEDGSFRPEFLADIQEKVDTLYKEFTEFVAVNRNLSVESVVSTQAKTFLPEKALELGLIDKVMTVDGFYEYLSEMAVDDTASKTRENGMLNKNKLFKLNKKEETPVMNIEELQAKLTASESQLAEVIASKTSLEEQLASLSESLSGKDAELSALTEKVAELEKAKVETALAARKEKLSAVVSQEKVEELVASMASLSDESFNTVLAGFAQSKKAAEASELFNELGSAGAEREVSEEDKKLSSAAAEQTKNLIRQKLNLK